MNQQLRESLILEQPSEPRKPCWRNHSGRISPMPNVISCPCYQQQKRPFMEPLCDVMVCFPSLWAAIVNIHLQPLWAGGGGPGSGA